MDTGKLGDLGGPVRLTPRHALASALQIKENPSMHHRLVWRKAMVLLDHVVCRSRGIPPTHGVDLEGIPGNIADLLSPLFRIFRMEVPRLSHPATTTTTKLTRTALASLAIFAVTEPTAQAVAASGPALAAATGGVSIIYTPKGSNHPITKNATLGAPSTAAFDNEADGNASAYVSAAGPFVSASTSGGTYQASASATYEFEVLGPTNTLIHMLIHGVLYSNVQQSATNSENTARATLRIVASAGSPGINGSGIIYTNSVESDVGGFYAKVLTKPENVEFSDSFEVVANYPYTVSLTALAINAYNDGSANAGADPFIKVDYSYPGSGSYYVVTSSNVTNELAVPEPGTLALMALGCSAVAWGRRKLR